MFVADFAVVVAVCGCCCCCLFDVLLGVCNMLFVCLVMVVALDFKIS